MTGGALFAGAGPHVFTMPPGARFLDALASGVLAACEGEDPFALSDALILTPTRRAARELAEAFARHAPGEATLLPAIRPLGDVEEDEDPFEPGEVAFALPPAVSPARRRFELASLLMRRDAALGRPSDPAGALALADELAKLLDDAATEGGADLAAIAELYEQLPAHLQEAAAFLDIIAEHWPARQREMGRIEPAERRDRLLRVLAGRWETRAPSGPVIAAGSTGAIPATAALLSVVARLPRGAVVLPGLDKELDVPAWDAIDEPHPQAGLKRLLSALDVEREEVRDFPLLPHAGEGEAARRRLINEALRPAAATADWLDRVAALRAAAGDDPIGAGLAGLALLEAVDEAGEADAIAMAVRAELEDPDATVLLVTPDRGLARRVAAGLTRWNVEMDASMGAPLAETSAGGFLKLVLEVALDPADPVALAGLAKHALAGFGQDRAALARRFGELERAVLRGVRAGDGFAGLHARLDRREEDAPAGAAALIDAMAAALDPLIAAAGAPGEAANLAAAHVGAAEAAAATAETSGAARLWAGPDGEAAAALLRELLEEAEALGDITLDAYARLFERLSRARAVRAAGAEHPRVRALTPIEARLLSADLVILGGLNEGSWPAATPPDPFLSRGMRAAAGLAPLERRVGLAAHDFAQLACAPRVLLTRAKRAEGAPTVASRWLWRLKTLAAGAGVADALAPETDWQ
ncbi:MAG: double-strand break repair protein AddB, partial [Caulobacterales bacterium]|nr:double-strand break repair protein AddB [Caulobacterales bacterium]